MGSVRLVHKNPRNLESWHDPIPPLFRPCKRVRQGAELLAVSLGEKFVGACGLIILLTGTMIALRFIIA
jgi:hypothetical protein